MSAREEARARRLLAKLARLRRAFARLARERGQTVEELAAECRREVAP